jgi:hypothetical protein
MVTGQCRAPAIVTGRAGWVAGALVAGPLVGGVLVAGVLVAGTGAGAGVAAVLAGVAAVLAGPPPQPGRAAPMAVARTVTAISLRGMGVPWVVSCR